MVIDGQGDQRCSPPAIVSPKLNRFTLIKFTTIIVYKITAVVNKYTE
jgi:hypothetical protein